MKDRNYGIDLLRIVAMFMIVILHILGHGEIIWHLPVLSIKYDIAWLLEIVCYCAVNCYGMISGYVLIDSDFKYKKLTNIWLSVVFWAFLITFIAKYTNIAVVYKIDFLAALLPVTFNQYWYFSCYFALFLFVPFINKYINSLDRNTFKKLLFTMFILFSAIELYKKSFALNGGYSFVWLVCLYFYGAYIKKYVDVSKVKKTRLILLLVSCYLITFFSKYLILKYNIDRKIITDSILVNYTSFTMVIISICLLILFSSFNIKNKYARRFVKRLSPATFGVYLIHVQLYVWNELSGKFLFLTEYSAVSLILNVFMYAFIIYMICSYLELIRIFMFKKLKIYSIVGSIYDFFNKKIQIFFNKIFAR